MDNSVMAIDWKFISGIEGELKNIRKKNGEEIGTGYVPPTHLPSKLGSGFTVGSLDVGQHSREDIRTMLQAYANFQAGGGKGSDIVGATRGDLLKKLEPYTKDKDSDEGYGRIGSVWEEYGSQEGYDMLARTEEFKKKDIEYIMDAKRYQVGEKLKKRQGWDKLDDRTQTVLASNAWQWGTGKQDDDRNRFEELWEKRGNKAELGKLLKEFGREGYKGRRDLEADYVNPSEEISYMDQWIKEDNIFGQMENKVKDEKMKGEMASMLAKWLYKDFGILIEAPTEKEIAKALEDDGRE